MAELVVKCPICDLPWTRTHLLCLGMVLFEAEFNAENIVTTRSTHIPSSYEKLTAVTPFDLSLSLYGA